MDRETSTSTQANRDLGLGALDMNVILGQVRRQVLGVDEPVEIAHFELLRRLGAGAMGVVYLARDPKLDREVAIKHLHPHIVDSPRGKSAQQRMQREAQAMARLTHPNVVAVYEFGMDQGQLFIAMEYVQGITLRAWLDAGDEHPWRRVLDIFLGAGEGLAAAHDAGLVHRDFKPQNVLLGEGAQAVKVSDFGLASAAGPLARPENTEQDKLEVSEPDLDQLMASATGGVLGTPAYMAPECYAGAHADTRSDQFSFCVTLYEALYGERPFTGASYGSLAEAVTSGRLRPRPRGGAVPPWLLTVLERGLALAPEQRWPSMSALLDALRHDPRALRRRRWGFAGLALVLAGLGGAGLAKRQAHDRQVTACEARGDEVREIWNPELRAKLEASFAGDGAGYVDKVVEHVGVALDDYVEQWSEARSELCLEIELHQTWEPELARRAVRCLDAHRSWAGLLVDEISGLEGRAFLNMGRDLMTLPELAPCLDPAYLRGLPELPEGLEQAQRELNHSFQQVKLLHALNRHDEALEMAQRAHEQANQLNWPPLIAEAKFELGITYMRAIQPEVGARIVEDAYFLAVECKAVPIAVSSATWMAELSVYAPGLALNASQWLRHARVALAGLERPDEGLLDRLDQQTMILATTMQDPMRAIEIGERLLLRVRARLGDEHPTVIHARVTLGHGYLALGRLDEAEAMLEEALAVEERWFGEGGPMYARMLTGLAEINAARGDLEGARALYERGLIDREAIEGRDTLGVAAVIEMLARHHERAGQYEQARGYYERELAIRERHMGSDHPLVARKHEELAGVLIALGERELALEQLEAAVGVHLQRPDFDVIETLLALHARALELRQAGELDAALELYAEILDQQTKIEPITNEVRPLPPAPPLGPPPGGRLGPPPGLNGPGSGPGFEGPRSPGPSSSSPPGADSRTGHEPDR